MLSVMASLSACNGSDEEETSSDLDPNVKVPAMDILEAEGTLHIFTLQDFDTDPTDDVPTRAFIANFSMPAVTYEPDEEDEDETLNDLGWTENKWVDSSRDWVLISNPELDTQFEDLREYRVLEDGNLQAPVAKLNQPTFEAIDENIYERYLGAIFVWDMDNLTDKAGEDVSGEEIADYQDYEDYAILPEAEIWGDNVDFSEGAVIYGATRSVAADVITVEAVGADGSFSLSPTHISSGDGEATIEDALASFPLYGTTRLAYQFTLNYGTTQLTSYKPNAVRYETNNTIYLTFDTNTLEVGLYTNSTGSSLVTTTSYTDYSTDGYIEIDTRSLDEGDRKLLGLPTYFNPVILGPFSTDGSALTNTTDNAYFYGKHYIKTTDSNRTSLDPVLFLNPTAKNDVMSAFESYQDERYDDLN